MEMLFERLSPPQIIALVSILSGSVVALALIAAITKFQFQALADAIDLQREKQHADLAVRQALVERAASAAEAVEAIHKLDAADRAAESGGVLKTLRTICGG